jgi:xanthine dehydrogenase accessory factor
MMDEVFDQLETLTKREKRVAMATLVATRGTSPKKEGAKMWVSEQGLILGSVTIGGCVDARVIEASEEALASLEPQVFSIDLGEEDAWETGFTCAGTVQVLIEPVDLTDPDSKLLNLYRAVRVEVEQGKCATVATRLESPSSRVVIFEDGRAEGTLGNAALDQAARATALELMGKRVSRTIALSCGSSATEVFFERHGPSDTLIVFGAGEVSMHLVNLAKEMGLKTIVIDGRPRFATRERFPHTDELLIGIPSEIARSLAYTSSTFVVLAAHDYKYDIPVLKVVLKTEAAYIGMLGSRRRGQAILEFLKETGVEQSALDRIRVPMGLDIGAQSSAEIALSILAEAMAVKADRPGTSMSRRK